MTSSIRESFAATGSPLPQRMPALPPARDFLVSSGFGGAAALLAALVVVLVAVFALRQASKRGRLQLEQQDRHQRELRAEARHAAAVKECRERLAWVVDKGNIEPAASQDATLGFGPELALTLLQGLVQEARQLDDATLAAAAAVQLKQFSRVLAKQGSALSTFSETASLAGDSGAEHQPAPTPTSQTAAPSASDKTGPPTQQVSAGGRRRRQ